MTAGKSSEKDAEKRRNRQNGLSKKYAKLMRKWRNKKFDVWAFVQEIWRKSTDLLRRIIAPVGG